jgi:hypothetical protein
VQVRANGQRAEIDDAIFDSFREVAEYVAIAFGITGAPHGALLASGRHAPMFLVPELLQSTESASQFATAILAWSYVHSLLQSSEPSVALAMLFHAAANITNTALSLRDSQRALTAVCVRRQRGRWALDPTATPVA